MSRGARPSRSHLPLPLRVPLPLASAHRSPAPSHTGSCRSAEVTSLATEEPPDGVDLEDGEGQASAAGDEFEEKAFFVLDRTTRPRNWCITVVVWPYPFAYDTIRYDTRCNFNVVHSKADMSQLNLPTTQNQQLKIGK